MPDFVLPPIHDNPDGTWGPSTSTLPAQFKDIPYAPYSKSDKINRIADWHDATDLNRPAGRNAYGGARRQGREAYGASESTAFGYVHEEDERSFSLVDSGARPNNRAKIGGQRGRGGARGAAAGARGGRGGRPAAFQPRGGFTSRTGRGGRSGFGDWNKSQRTRDSSVTVGPEWVQLEEIEFTRLAKLSLSVDQPEDLESHGMVQAYDKAFDRINTRTEKPLDILDRVRYNATTSEDPIISQASAARLLAGKGAAQIFATDSILSVLMCTNRSVNSWDIILDRRGDQLFFDKREGGPFDYITVNENAAEPPADSDDQSNINSPSSLSLEATYINQNFSSQVISASSKPYEPKPNPFYSAEDETEPLASCLYRYRKFDLSVDEEESMDLVVRTEVDAYQGKKDSFVTVKALNEFDPKTQGGAGKALEWRKFLDTQKGAIVAGEMKNNSAKLARWAVQGYLAGAEQMKMGYISRVNPRDAQRHSIVGVQSYKPLDFARQMNVSLANGWGIVRTIADLVLKQPEGKYVLVKDPNSPVIRLYSVPADAFDAGLIDEDQMDDE